MGENHGWISYVDDDIMNIDGKRRNERRLTVFSSSMKEDTQGGVYLVAGTLVELLIILNRK